MRMPKLTRIELYTYVAILYLIHAILTFLNLQGVLGVPRIITSIPLLFFVPGFFIYILLFRTEMPEEFTAYFIVAISSVAANILWALFMNKVVGLQFNEVNIFLMNLSLTVIVAVAERLAKPKASA